MRPTAPAPGRAWPWRHGAAAGGPIIRLKIVVVLTTVHRHRGRQRDQEQKCDLDPEWVDPACTLGQHRTQQHRAQQQQRPPQSGQLTSGHTAVSAIVGQSSVSLMPSTRVPLIHVPVAYARAALDPAWEVTGGSDLRLSHEVMGVRGQKCPLTPMTSLLRLTRGYRIPLRRSVSTVPAVKSSSCASSTAFLRFLGSGTAKIGTSGHDPRGACHMRNQPLVVGRANESPD